MANEYKQSRRGFYGPFSELPTGATAGGHRMEENGEVSIVWAIFPSTMSNAAVLDTCENAGWFSVRLGPGRPFSDGAHIRARTGTRVLATCRCGLDI